MAVPSSGELELRGDIALEVYGNATGNNISLGAMSDLAGFSEPDSMSDFYGYVSAVAPTVVTNNATSVTGSSMVLNGNVTSDGGATITSRGFYFGTNGSNPQLNTQYSVGGTTGAFSLSRTGLAEATYYIWAYAENSEGETIGNRITQVIAFQPVLNQRIPYSNAVLANLDLYGIRYAYAYYIHPTTSAYVMINGTTVRDNDENWSESSQLAWFNDRPYDPEQGAWTFYENSGKTLCSNATNQLRSGGHLTQSGDRFNVFSNEYYYSTLNAMSTNQSFTNKSASANVPSGAISVTSLDFSSDNYRLWTEYRCTSSGGTIYYNGSGTQRAELIQNFDM